MTNYTYTAKGTGVFIIGFILSLILGYTLPGVMEASQDALVQEIGQYVMILIWVLGVLIIPNFYFYKAIQTENDQEPFFQVIISILMLLFTFAFLYKGNFIITGLASFVEGGFLLGLYWIGILSVIGFGYILTPIATIIQVSRKGQ